MKKAKVMLSIILILAVVASALAFKVKSDYVCLYTTTFTAPTDNPITSTKCEFVTTDNFHITYADTYVEFAHTLDTEILCPQTTECYRADWVIAS